MIDVRDHGAREGTDSTAAFVSAATVAAENGGGVVDVPPGVWEANAVLPPLVHLRGAGPYMSTIRTPAGSMEPAIKSQGFDDLTGKPKQSGDYLRGAYGYQISGLKVDGNRQSGATGNGISIWGSSGRIDNVVVQNAGGHGIYHEFTRLDTIDTGVGVAASTAPPDANTNTFLTRLELKRNGGDGIHYRGPNDGKLSQVVAWGNEGWAAYFDGNPSGDGTGGGCEIHGFNSFFNGAGSFYVGTNCPFISDSIASGPNTGTGIHLNNTGTMGMSNVVVGSHQVGVLFDGAQQVTFSGVVSDCQDGVVIRRAGQIDLKWTSRNNDTHFEVEDGAETLPNRYAVNVLAAAGETPWVLGSGMSAKSQLELTAVGAVNDSLYVLPGEDTRVLGRLRFGQSGGYSTTDPTMTRYTGGKIDASADVVFPNPGSGPVVVDSMSGSLVRLSVVGGVVSATPVT